MISPPMVPQASCVFNGKHLAVSVGGCPRRSHLVRVLAQWGKWRRRERLMCYTLLVKHVAGRCEEAAGSSMCHRRGTWCLSAALPGPAAVTATQVHRGTGRAKMGENGESGGGDLRNGKNLKPAF